MCKCVMLLESEYSRRYRDEDKQIIIAHSTNKLVYYVCDLVDSPKMYIGRPRRVIPNIKGYAI